MVDKIRGGGGEEPSSVSASQQRKMYEAEYKHAADLFERSLNEHAKSDNPYQKEAFRKVMDQSMSILNDTAYQLKKEELLRQNRQIEQDYAAYRKDSSISAKSQLEHDLERAKHSIS